MPRFPAPIPTRIWVVGPPGSGKSTVADALGCRLGLPVFHLDDWHFASDWVERPWEDLLARVDPVTRGDRWVVEGNYRVVRHALLPRADLVVWLDLPLSVAFPRLLVRTARRALFREPCCNGNRERLSHVLRPTGDSILWWALTRDRPLRRTLGPELAGRSFVRLRHPRAVSRWLGAAVAPRG